ncbi:hypothetical protein [Paenibacillus sp. SN-8-1]
MPNAHVRALPLIGAAEPHSLVSPFRKNELQIKSYSDTSFFS